MGDEVSDDLAARLARNEAAARDLNRARTPWLTKGGDGFASFWCECSQPSCVERVRLTQEEWQRVRSNALWFLVAPDHDDPRICAVVEKADRHWIVEKTHEKAAEIARRTADDGADRRHHS